MIGEAAHADDIWMDMGGLDWATERKVEDALCCIGLVVEWLQGFVDGYTSTIHLF